eukprot:tig00001487_g8944.t1
MAGKGGGFQVSVDSAAGYDKEMLFTGLAVVEVMSGYYGPCKCVVNFFKNLYFEVPDAETKIKFIIADADKIPKLAEYSEKAEPTFLFYKKGQLLEKIKGVQSPAIRNLIKNNV